jgi:pyruvate dehydrogenase E1 component alpha subunit
MPTVQADGNDLLAMYQVTREAVDRARRGDGPSFIEALTYRLGDHTTADDARRYRPADELDAAMGRDPMMRTRKFLESRGLWDVDQQARADEKAKVLIHEVVQVALNIARPPATDMFDYTFAELPAELQLQRKTLRTDSIGQEPGQIGLQPPMEADVRERESIATDGQ